MTKLRRQAENPRSLYRDLLNDVVNKVDAAVNKVAVSSELARKEEWNMTRLCKKEGECEWKEEFHLGSIYTENRPVAFACCRPGGKKCPLKEART